MALADIQMKKIEKPQKSVASLMNPEVSVIVAVQGQKDELASINKKLHKVLFEYHRNFELVYVDDGSVDGSWQVLKNIKAEFPAVKLIRLRTKFGESSALDAGLRSASGKKILYFTCRIRINPRDVCKFFIKLDEGYDLVLGVRYPRRDSALNRAVSKLFNFTTNKLTKLHLHDINSGILATKKEVLDNLPIYGVFNAFMPVLAHRQGYKVTEEKIEQLPGNFAQSMYPKNYIRRFLDLISVLFMSHYSKKPLHFLGFIGAIFAILGAVIDIYLFIYRIFGFGGIAGRPMLLLGTVLLVIGIQMISIGLLGEMIIFTHAKSIREYNIEEILD